MSQRPPDSPLGQNQFASPPKRRLKPDSEQEDTPDFAEEFTTSGTEKNYWKNSDNKENSKELLL